MPLLAQALLYVFACLGVFVAYTWLRYRITVRRSK